MAPRIIGSSIFSQRLFSSCDGILFPHTRDYLQLQQKLFRSHNIPADITRLSKGTEVVGLNVSIAKPQFLSTRPVYHLEILKAITNNEKRGWFDLAESHIAQLGNYKLICDLSCITTKSEAGVPIYYIDNRFLDTQSYTPLHRVFDSVLTIPKP